MGFFYTVKVAKQGRGHALQLDCTIIVGNCNRRYNTIIFPGEETLPDKVCTPEITQFQQEQLQLQAEVPSEKKKKLQMSRVIFS